VRPTIDVTGAETAGFRNTVSSPYVSSPKTWRGISTQSRMQSYERFRMNAEDRGASAVPDRGSDQEFIERGGAEKAGKGQTEIGVPWAEVSPSQQVAAHHSPSSVAPKGHEKGKGVIRPDSDGL
jgi:hypothetical protein